MSSASYWDKLATQTAGGQAPDIIQMDMNYISEYGTRQALLDLAKVDVSKFTEGTVDSGKINDQLVGINAGVNSVIILGNPKIFEKAKVDVPDDTTWTWDSMIDVAAEVSAKAGVPFGVGLDLHVGCPVQCVRAPERPRAVQRRRPSPSSPVTPRPGST